MTFLNRKDTMLVRWFPQRAAVGYSRWTDRSIHLCFKTPRATFTARGSSVMRPYRYPTGEMSFVRLVPSDVAPSLDRTSLPHACAWVRAHVQHDSLRSPAPHRPHVSLSEALPSA